LDKGGKYQLPNHTEDMKKCLICGKNTRFKKGPRIKGYFYEICLFCGGATLQPRAKALRESSRVYTDEYFNWGQAKGIKKLVYSTYLHKDYPDWVEEEKSDVKRKILDVGAGVPTFVANMKKRGWDVYAQELSKSQAGKIASFIGTKKVFVGDFEKIRLSKDCFDVVTFWHVLEHVKLPAKVIKKTKDLLTEGGHIFVELPNLDSHTWKIFGDNYSLIRIPEHTFYFSANSLKTLLETNGFQVKKISYPLKLNSTFSASLIKAIQKKIKSDYFLNFMFYLSLPFSFAWSLLLSFLGRSEIIRLVAQKS
jgi:2-polyprenyl-3-methyl-5-hydroxy-6-metoxy-1,4-benzoquinol methylase